MTPYRARSDATGAWRVIDSRISGYNVIVASVPRLVAVSIAHRLNVGVRVVIAIDGRN